MFGIILSRYIQVDRTVHHRVEFHPVNVPLLNCDKTLYTFSIITVRIDMYKSAHFPRGVTSKKIYLQANQ